MRPLPQQVAFVAGASGVGTSTRAVQLQLELARADGRVAHLICTDVVRAQLRAVVDPARHPDLWSESFDVPPRDEDTLRGGVNVDGFLRQCGPILRAVEAGVDYALGEGWHVVVEGVHLVPGRFRLPLRAAGAPPLDRRVELLTLHDRAEHLRRLREREAASDGRRAAPHYARNLDRVHRIQDELVEHWQGWRAQLGGQDRLTLVGP